MSDAFTMLEKGSCISACYAQVGWLHWYLCSNPNFTILPGGGGSCSNDGLAHVFVEWTDNNGAPSDVYYYGQAFNNEDYTVTRSLTNGTESFTWNEGSASAASSTTFQPDRITDVEEVGDYGSGNLGSQLGGNSSNRVSFNDLRWADQYTYTVHTPNMNQEWKQAYGALQPLTTPVTSTFYAWDSRCP